MAWWLGRWNCNPKVSVEIRLDFRSSLGSGLILRLSAGSFPPARLEIEPKLKSSSLPLAGFVFGSPELSFTTFCK